MNDTQRMAKTCWSEGKAAVVGALALGLIGVVGGGCTSKSTAGDGGTASSDAGGTTGGDAAAVAATCAGVCGCLASACPDFPFAPDCVTACQDPTNNPVWDLSCRATECRAAQTDHDTHCPNASGQTTCH